VEFEPARTSFRVAVVADAAAIAAIHVASWQTTYPGIVAQSYIDGLSINERTNTWERRLRGHAGAVSDVILAETASGVAVGFASGGAIRESHPGFDAELHAIYILKNAQRRGIGRGLVGEWAKLAVGRGLRAAVVRVLAANSACEFYRRLGARWVKDATLEIAGQSYTEAWYAWDDLHALAAKCIEQP
jgi:ribosomal protein S18 acetylase RimI-like enzyme